MSTITADELAELLNETAENHHHAYITADGNDPEWALWYAGYIQSHLFGRLETLPSRSQLVHLLLSAEAAHTASGGEGSFAAHYAATMLETLS